MLRSFTSLPCRQAPRELQSLLPVWGIAQISLCRQLICWFESSMIVELTAEGLTPSGDNVPLCNQAIACSVE